MTFSVASRYGTEEPFKQAFHSGQTFAVITNVGVHTQHHPCDADADRLERSTPLVSCVPPRKLTRHPPINQHDTRKADNGDPHREPDTGHVTPIRKRLPSDKRKSDRPRA